jgi:DNA-binding NtrC family response regulator
VMTIEIPPLRERVEDIPCIAQSIVSTLAEELQLSHPPEIPPETVELLTHYHWPGNVRELRNVLERALILGEGKHFHFLLPLASDGEDLLSTSEFLGRTLRDVTDEITRAMCVDALKRARGNRKEAARLLGIARDSLYRYMRQYEIEEPATANSHSDKK